MFKKMRKALWGTEHSGDHEVEGALEDAPGSETTSIPVGDARRLLASVDADREIVGSLRRVASLVAKHDEVVFDIRGGYSSTIAMADPRVVQAVLSCLRILIEDIEGQAVSKENSLRVSVASENEVYGGNDA